MKNKLFILLLALLLLSGCGKNSSGEIHIAATTKPVCYFAQELCSGTGLEITPLITESVSCLHDYSLSVDQVRAAESADLILCSGAGLEHFMEDILDGKDTVDSSDGLSFLVSDDDPDEPDPHIWLSPENAKAMVSNLAAGLCRQYPEYSSTFKTNEAHLQTRLDTLLLYGQEQLSDLSCRDLITFHDGFAYFAQAFDLNILEAIEEEAGSEASARELIRLIQIVQERRLPAIFTETNGSPSAASVISAETGAKVFSLDMGMSDLDYFDCMYHNINTLKEALG